MRRPMEVSAQQLVAIVARFQIPVPEIEAYLYRQDLYGLKQRVKQAWRKLAFELHPDRGGDEERFKEMNALQAALQSLEPHRQAPPVVMQGAGWVRVEVVHTGTGSWYAGWGSTGTTTSVYGVF